MKNLSSPAKTFISLYFTKISPDFYFFFPGKKKVLWNWMKKNQNIFKVKIFFPCEKPHLHFIFILKLFHPVFHETKIIILHIVPLGLKKKKKILLGKKTKKQENFFSKWETKFLPKLVFELSVLRFFSYFPFFYRTFFLFLLYKNVHEKHFWETKWRKTFRVKYFLFSGDFFNFSNRDFTAETNITFCFLLIFFPMTCFNWWKKNKGFKND